MKKYSQKYVVYLLKKSSNQQKKQTKKNRLKVNRRGRYNAKERPHSIHSPRRLSLIGDYSRETFEFIKGIKEKAYRYKRVEIMFNHLTDVYAEAMALLLAEVTVLIQNKVLVTIIRPPNPRENAALLRIGFFKLLNMSSNAKPKKYRNVIRWRSAASYNLSGENIARLVEFDNLEKNLQNKLMTGVSEAISNSITHGYIDNREGNYKVIDNGSDNRWWALSSFDEDKSRFTLITVDLGIGIPNSIKDKYDEIRKNGSMAILKIIRKIFSGNEPDHAIIRAILDYRESVPLSRTNEPYRGLGLQRDILSLTDNKASTLILSNEGCYKKSPTSKVSSSQLKGSVYGTIIIWRLDLNEENNEQNI